MLVWDICNINIHNIYRIYELTKEKMQMVHHKLMKICVIM